MHIFGARICIRRAQIHIYRAWICIYSANMPVFAAWIGISRADIRTFATKAPQIGFQLPSPMTQKLAGSYRPIVLKNSDSSKNGRQ